MTKSAIPTANDARPAPTLEDCADGLRRGKTTAIALVEASIARAEAINPRLNAIVHLAASAALSAARESDDRRRAGRLLGALDGIPFVVKDNIFVRGMPVTNGSHGFAAHIPAEDEIVIARLRAAGMIPLGMTNTPEFAAQGYTGNLRYGVTRNPWNPQLTPGGSSGGSAAAVAAGIVPAAIGTDGGGSTRRPAGHTGVVGFKPSTGAIPRWPTFPVISLDFEAIGLIAHTVAGVQMLFEATRGPDPRDRSSRCMPQGANGKRRSHRIYSFRGIGERPVDPEVLSDLDRTADRFKQLGYTIDVGPEPFDAAAMDFIYSVVVGSGVGALALPLLQQGAEVGKPLAEVTRKSQEYTAVDFTRAWHMVLAHRERIGRLFTTYDFILTPAAAALPWRAEDVNPVSIAGRPAAPRDHAPYTRFANVSGNPGIVFPTGLTRSGLPMGSQLIGDFGDDAVLLSVAAQYAATFPFRSGQDPR